MRTLSRYKRNLAINGNKILSYGTHVATINFAEKTITRHGFWSSTTSKHINYVGKYWNLIVLKETKKIEEEENNEIGILKCAGLFSLMNSLEAQTTEEQNETDTRIFKAVGVSIPDDWDENSPEEKRKRLDAIRKISLNQLKK